MNASAPHTLAPYLTNDLPGIGGVLKHEPEDFVVEEIPAYQPCGEGEHLFLWVEKRDVSAEDLVAHVARSVGIRREDIGIAGQEAETMTGVFVPAATPKAVVDLLQREISSIVNAPDIKAKLLQAGVEAEGNSTVDFTAYVKADIAKWKKVITDAKIPLIGG